MNLRIILVEPEYGGNIGFTARAMKNFNAKELFLVNPKEDYLGVEAKSRSMNAFDVLSNARIVSTLSDALKGTAVSVAFTAKTTKKKGLNRTAQSLQEFAKNFAEMNLNSLALVFGNERNGLKNSQLNECDFIVTIPTHHSYKSMNLSHSVAVALYALDSASSRHLRVKQIDENLKNLLAKEFNELINAGGKIRQKQKTLNAFKALISRSPASEAEAKAILSVLKAANKAIKFE